MLIGHEKVVLDGLYGEREFFSHAPLRELLMLAVAAVGEGMDADSAPGHEDSLHLEIAGIHQLPEVVEYDVHAVFMEVSMVAEAEEIELEALALNHPVVRDIADADFRKVRLACNRAETGEFRAIETYPIIIFRMLVLEGFKYLRSIIHLVIRLISEGLQALKFSSF